VHTTGGCSLKTAGAAPFEPGHEESWLPFYDAPKSWQTHGAGMAGGALETHLRSVESSPHGSFCGAVVVAGASGACRPRHPTTTTERIEQDLFGRSANLDSTLHTVPSTALAHQTRSGALCLDAVRDRSLLRLWIRRSPHHNYSRTKSAAELCILVTPQVGYDTRLFAAVVAMHLWEHLAASRGAAVTR